MGSFTIQLASVVFRSFIPINSFYVNYLTESKGFSNQEVTNSIIPFYFYSSIVGVFFSLIFWMAQMDAYGSVLLSAAYLINMVLLFRMPKRKIAIAKLVYFISGFSYSFDIILRFYIADSNPVFNTSDLKFSYLQIIRAASVAISCILSQRIAIKTQSHQINVILSILSLFVSFILSIYDLCQYRRNDIIKTPFHLFKFQSLLLKKELIAIFSIGVISNSICLFVKMFFQSIYRDRFTCNLKSSGIRDDKLNDKSDNVTLYKKSTGSLSVISKSLWYLYSVLNQGIVAIFDSLADLAIKAICIFYRGYTCDQSVNNSYLSAHIDAVTVLIYQITSFFVIKNFTEKSKTGLYVLLLSISSILLLLMLKTTNKILFTSIYLITLTLANISNIISKSVLKIYYVNNNIVVLNFIMEALVHILISLLCSFFSFSIKSRVVLYSTLGLVSCSLSYMLV